MHAKYQVAMFNIGNVIANVKISDVILPLTLKVIINFDLFTTQNVQVDEIHMKKKPKNCLTLKDDLDLSPLKMCRAMRYTCMPNIKLLSSILQKL